MTALEMESSGQNHDLGGAMAPVLWIGHPRSSGRAGAQGPLPESCRRIPSLRVLPSRAGNPVEFATDAGLQRRYLRRSGASENWHHASQAAYDQRAQQARASATGTGAAGAPNPKDESGTQAPPPAETSAPYERSKAPEPEPSRQRTIPELRSTKDFVEWVTAVADFQALVEPDVHGVLQAAEFGAVWRSRMETLAKTPTIVCDLPNVPLRDKKVSGKVVISEEGRLTIATTTTTRNQAGQVLREEEQVLPRATLWVGGLHAFLQHAIYVCRSASGRSPRPTSSSSRWPSRRSTTLLRSEPTTPPAASYITLRATQKRMEPLSNLLTEKRPSKSSARSPSLNLAEFSLQQDVGLLTAATHARTSERRRTTTAGIGMKIGELLPNGLGSRGSPIAGIHDAFSSRSMT